MEGAFLLTALLTAGACGQAQAALTAWATMSAAAASAVRIT